MSTGRRSSRVAVSEARTRLRRERLALSEVLIASGAATVVALVHLHVLYAAARKAPVAVLAALAVAVAALLLVVAVIGAGRLGRRAHGSGSGATPVGWAKRRDLGRLLVRRPPGDRVVLGCCGRDLVAAEARQSVLVVGPSQSGKTTSLAVPALASWQGPVLATSVKTDLVRATIDDRSGLGETALFDPTGVTGMRANGWSPLGGNLSWRAARRIARSLCSIGRRDGGMDDASFWYSSAERLIAPLLLAAAFTSGSMSDVVRWLDEETADEPLLALELAGEREAARTARSCMALEERQRSSVYATAQSVVAAYSDPEVAASEKKVPRLSPEWLLEGGWRTLYCAAPARDQARLSPVFVALVQEVVDAALERSSRSGLPLDPPLLVVLDEAANVAPLDDLDRTLATAAGHGVVLVTIWQDLSQVEARYGTRWATIVNNHRAKVVFPGVADPRTLELLSSLIGDAERSQRSRSFSRDGAWTETEGTARVPIAPAGWIRRLPDERVLVVYGGLPPALVAMRPRPRLP